MDETLKPNNRLKKYKWALAGFLLVANIFVWSAVSLAAPSGVLNVHFLDVGQGDAALIISPSGNQVLIDGGPGKQVLRELSKYKNYFDRQLDLAIESHPDSDHIGGFPDVFDLYDVGGFISPGSVSQSGVYFSLKKVVADEKSPNLLATAGERIDLGGGAYLDIISPVDGRALETNASSVILKLVYKDRSFLFTGDMPTAVGDYLVASGQDLHADVYKVSHHGSKNSNDLAFIKAVAPSISVISVGKDNRYGHPNKEVLDYLNEAKSKILRTDQVGDINIQTDGTNLVVE